MARRRGCCPFCVMFEDHFDYESGLTGNWLRVPSDSHWWIEDRFNHYPSVRKYNHDWALFGDTPNSKLLLTMRLRDRSDIGMSASYWTYAETDEAIYEVYICHDYANSYLMGRLYMPVGSNPPYMGLYRVIEGVETELATLRLSLVEAERVMGITYAPTGTFCMSVSHAVGIRESQTGTGQEVIPAFLVARDVAPIPNGWYVGLGNGADKLNGYDDFQFGLHISSSTAIRAPDDYECDYCLCPCYTKDGDKVIDKYELPFKLHASWEGGFIGSGTSTGIGTGTGTGTGTGNYICGTGTVELNWDIIGKGYGMPAWVGYANLAGYQAKLIFECYDKAEMSQNPFQVDLQNCNGIQGHDLPEPGAQCRPVYAVYMKYIGSLMPCPCFPNPFGDGYMKWTITE